MLRCSWKFHSKNQFLAAEKVLTTKKTKDAHVAKDQDACLELCLLNVGVVMERE